MSKSVDLRSCETLALSLAADTDRRTSVMAVCQRLGFDWRLVEAIASTPGRIGCGLSHLRALRLATAGRPLLILEDDVAVEDGFNPVIAVPDDADAVYLGASIYGAIDAIDYVGFTNMLAADDAGSGLLRVYNLLGAHAILYLTERFKVAAAEAILQSQVDADWEHDKGMARLQERFTVYAFRQPPFYQAATLQRSRGEHQERVTRTPLAPAVVGARSQVGIEDGWRDMVLVREGERLRWRWAEDG